MFQLHNLTELHSLTPQQIRHHFGGKLLGLYEAYQLGIAIPLTSMISAQVNEEFLKTAPSSDPEDFQQQAIGFIRDKLDFDALEEGLYAVRSSCQVEDSASHSYAGIFETKLNVSKSKIPEAIAYVWSSQLKEKAKSYSKGRSLMGVVIQPMIEAKYAGICFTKHPSPSKVFENGQIVVEFAPTSGEKVMQGEIIPFRLSGTADVLSSASENGWMDELLKSIFELKKKYHHEADIEFVVDADDDFWLLQQRPISKIYSSSILDLSDYRRMYKRSLLSLDIELLIDGCSRYLAAYLEVPINLERWMVMTTNEEGIQELWVDEVINETVLRAVIDKMEHDPTYLPRLEARYADHFRRIQGAQPDRLFEWFEWITPFAAHYYAPMFIIEALFVSLTREFPNQDLFATCTAGIASMVDLLNQELRHLKDRSYEECESHLHELARRFGFLKCRQPFEDPYSPQELFEMIRDVPEASEMLQQEELSPRLEHLREWMRIRNQEMEYLLFAFLNARPMIDSVCKELSIDGETFWRSSKESLLKKQPKALTRLTILQHQGKTHVTDQIEVRYSDPDHFTDIKGRTVYGKGILEATVKVAFTPEELKAPTQRPCVLVTGMTTPDFVPHIRKHFDALITDEGGILCHAAIVAREIPIACIVGTGSASSLLKDGMQVRIDFDRGEIERIHLQ